MVKVNIQRFDGIKTYTSTYEIPIDTAGYSVMDLLDYIYQNLDNTLAYYRHSICNQGICARCMLKVDGTPVLACMHRPSGAEITLAPRTGKVIRDLVSE